MFRLAQAAKIPRGQILYKVSLFYLCMFWLKDVTFSRRKMFRYIDGHKRLPIIFTPHYH